MNTAESKQRMAATGPRYVQRLVSRLRWWHAAVAVMLMVIWHGCSIEVTTDGNLMNVKAKGQWGVSIGD